MGKRKPTGFHTHQPPIRHTYLMHQTPPSPPTTATSLLHCKQSYWLACALLWNSQQPLYISSHWLHKQSVIESRPIRRSLLQSGERGRGCGWLSDDMQWRERWGKWGWSTHSGRPHMEQACSQTGQQVKIQLRLSSPEPGHTAKCTPPKLRHHR